MTRQQALACRAAGACAAAVTLVTTADAREGNGLQGRLAVGVTRQNVDELYVIPAAGGSAARMISRRGDGATASRPAWSPDGSQIAFASSSVAGSRIDLVEPDGSRLRPLTRPRPRYEVFDGSPTWSRDGEFVRFSRATVHGETSTLTLRRVRPNGSGARTLWTNSDETRGDVLTLSPGGREMLYSRHIDLDTREELFAANLDGSGTRRLTRSRIGTRIGNAVWSPDGRRIVYCAGPAATLDRLIWIVNANGSGARQLLRTRASCALAWSPTGEWIAFGRYPAGLFAVRADDSGLRQIDPNLPATSLSWTR